MNSKPRVLFAGSLYAGHKTRYLNLKAHTEDDQRISATYRHVGGWREGGLVERATFMPRSVRGRLRALSEASALATLPRPDVIWTSVWEVATPYLTAMQGPLRRPLALDLDRTYDQLESMAPHYFNRAPKSGAALALSLAIERTLWRSTTLFLPWSNWAADGLKRRGVRRELIQVVPPGVDLDDWKPAIKPPMAEARRLRLLFVGGDFVRKGGDLLVDVFRTGFSGRCELDIVTQTPHKSNSEGLRFHRAEPNSPLLRELYARADLFVLPTRADCFGIASVEAMASGLPVIMGNVGGAPDIVREGETGWLIAPTAVGLTQALEAALALRRSLPGMGERARTEAEARFDGARNDRHIVDLLLEQVARHRAIKP